MQSYGIFIYECNRTQWGGRNSIYARVGIRAGAREILHPLSGNASVSDIGCENEPATPWNNVLYDLTSLNPSRVVTLSTSLPQHTLFSSVLQPLVTLSTSISGSSLVSSLTKLSPTTITFMTTTVRSSQLSVRSAPPTTTVPSNDMDLQSVSGDVRTSITSTSHSVLTSVPQGGFMFTCN